MKSFSKRPVKLTTIQLATVAIAPPGVRSLVATLLAALAMAVMATPAAATAVELSEEEAAATRTQANTQTSSQAVSAFSSGTEQAETLTLNLVLSLSERRVTVYRGDMLVASYAVAVGREGWQTPTGEFSIFQKQTDPAWEHPFTGEVLPPGPENPLGTRWIGFWSDGTNSIGFHGTPDESVIGSAVSHGCVRMRNEDVLALYEQVGIDTPVTVLP